MDLMVPTIQNLGFDKVFSNVIESFFGYIFCPNLDQGYIFFYVKM